MIVNNTFFQTTAVDGAIGRIWDEVMATEGSRRLPFTRGLVLGMLTLSKK